MTAHAYHGIDPDLLEPGHAYRVDYKHERLRRSFRLKGTFVGRDVRPIEEEGEPVDVLVFEVKPRFGEPAEQAVGLSTLQSIEEP
jgi:hypothetical protein